MVLGLLSCGAPEMDAELIKSMTLGYENGVVSGVGIGDSFEDVKKNIHKEWMLENPEKSEFTTYKTSSFSKSYDMMNFISGSISFDSNGKVFEMSYSISGKEGNHLLIAELQNALQKEFNAKYTAEADDSWGYKAPNGDDCGITMNINEQDSGSHTLSVSVFNLSQ